MSADDSRANFELKQLLGAVDCCRRFACLHQASQKNAGARRKLQMTVPTPPLVNMLFIT